MASPSISQEVSAARVTFGRINPNMLGQAARKGLDQLRAAYESAEGPAPAGSPHSKGTAPGLNAG